MTASEQTTAAAEGMVELARHKLPGADLRVGPIEELPWPIAVAS
jgi:hypothetical protein